MNCRKALLDEIRKCEQDNLLAVTNETPASIETDDFVLDKPIKYRLFVPDEAWYAGRLRFVSESARRLGGHLAGPLASLLASLDPDMTRTLTEIYLVDGEADVDALCKTAGADPEEIPETVMQEDGDGALGCLWSDRCAIILDLAAIRQTADEVCTEADAYINPATEFDIGVQTTLTHEVYHLAAADPFLELESDGRDDEGDAERYGIDAYEAWKYGRRRPETGAEAERRMPAGYISYRHGQPGPEAEHVLYPDMDAMADGLGSALADGFPIGRIDCYVWDETSADRLFAVMDAAGHGRAHVYRLTADLHPWSLDQ